MPQKIKFSQVDATTGNGPMGLVGNSNVTQLEVRAHSSQTDSNSTDIARFFPASGTDNSNTTGISPAGNLRFGYLGGNGITWRGAGLINQNAAYFYSPNGYTLEVSTGGGLGDNNDKISLRLGAIEYAKLERPGGTVAFVVTGNVSASGYYYSPNGLYSGSNNNYFLFDVGGSGRPEIRSGVADGATSVAVRVGAHADYTTSGAKILSIGDNAGVAFSEKAYFDKDGAIVTGAHVWLGLGGSGLTMGKGHSEYIGWNNGTALLTSIQFPASAAQGMTLYSNRSDAAAAIAFTMAAKGDYVTAGAKLLSIGDNIDSAYAEKLSIDKDGNVFNGENTSTFVGYRHAWGGGGVGVNNSGITRLSVGPPQNLRGFEIAGSGRWVSLVGNVLEAATGDETFFDLAVGINKATSGNYTGIKLNVTETSAPGTDDRLLDLQVGGTSKVYIRNDGDIALNTHQKGLRSIGGSIRCVFASTNSFEISSSAAEASPVVAVGNSAMSLGAQVTMTMGVFSDAQRPSAGTAGRVIFNTTDANLNIDNGTNWILPDGTIT